MSRHRTPCEGSGCPVDLLSDGWGYCRMCGVHVPAVVPDGGLAWKHDRENKDSVDVLLERIDTHLAVSTPGPQTQALLAEAAQVLARPTPDLAQRLTDDVMAWWLTGTEDPDMREWWSTDDAVETARALVDVVLESIANWRALP